MREYEEGYPVDANDRYYQGDYPDPDRKNSSNFGFANVKRNAALGGNKVREDATDYLNERLKVMPYESTEVLFDQRVEFAGEEEGVWEMGETLPISVGDKVFITYDGVTYESEAVAFQENNVSFGNSAIIGGDSNGIPVAAITGKSDGMDLTAFMGAPGYHTIKIEKPVIHTIDPKFLPGGGGGKVIYAWNSADDTVVDESGNAVTAEQATKDMFNVVIEDVVDGGYMIPWLVRSGEGYVQFHVILGEEYTNITIGKRPK